METTRGVSLKKIKTFTEQLAESQNQKAQQVLKTFNDGSSGLGVVLLSWTLLGHTQTCHPNHKEQKNLEEEEDSSINGLTSPAGLQVGLVHFELWKDGGFTQLSAGIDVTFRF